jgi:DNA-nicking Smr family endonuclease
MSKRARPLSDDERVLWRAVTTTIAPLKGRKPGIAEAADPAPVAAAARGKPSKATPLAPSPQRVTPPPLATLDRRTKQRIARGRTEIDGRLDLHGLTQAEAHAVLARFLHQAQARAAKVVLVITGKGGEGRGVLKRQVPFWLESTELRSLVIGFENAGTGHGGEGALYVRVRRGR